MSEFADTEKMRLPGPRSIALLLILVWVWGSSRSGL